MALRVERRDGSVERAVLIGMIVDRRVLGAIAAKWERGMFASTWGALVGGWAVKYFRKYDKAPGPAIKNVYEQWASTGQDEDTVKLVEAFLGSLDDEYGHYKRTINPDFVIDQAAELFTAVRVNALRERLDGDMEARDTTKALANIEAFRRVEIGRESGIVLEPGCEAFRAALEDSHAEPLIAYPDAMGNFFAGALVRDGFISFLAKEKGGKCLTGETELLCADGRIVLIRDVVEQKDERPLVVFNEQSQRFIAVGPTEFYDNGEMECLEMRTRMGRRITATTTHPFLTPDGWKRFDELRVGDFVASAHTKTGQRYLGSGILWDEIYAVRSVGLRQVYDLSIPNHHNFVANDLVVHNSFFLMDLAVRAWEQKRNVVYIEAGDNSQHQFVRRLMARITGRPVKAGSYQYPISIEPPDGENTPATVETETRRAKRDMLAEDADAAAAELIRGTDSRFSFHCYPNRTVSVDDIKAKIEGILTNGGLPPDVVVIDYADILAPLDKTADRRDQINDSWMAMRSLSQIHHCLVVTATQGNAASYDAWIMTRKNFSEDKRKFGQVTGFYGIVQTAREQKNGQFHLNCMFHRDLEFSESKCVHLASCLSIGNPCILSTF